MDTTMIVRIVCGALFLVVLGVVIQRRRSRVR